MRRLACAALRIADFPEGWTQGTASPGKTASCTQIEAAKDLTSARLTGPDFNHGTFSHVQNAIYLFPDDRSAARVTVPLSAANVRLHLAVDVVFVRVSRGISIALFIDAPQPFEEALRGKRVSTTAKRLSDELG